MYALVKQWEDNGRSEQQTHFSTRALARILKKGWGSDVIDSITQSLQRLRANMFTWTNAYFDSTAPQAPLEIIDHFTVLSQLRIVRRKSDGHITKEAGYFRFDDFILKNLRNNHTKPVLLDVILQFKSEIAQLLYTHVDLMLNDKSLYVRRSKELFAELGLTAKEYNRPYERKRKLARALEELRSVPLSAGGVIEHATLEKTKDGADYKVSFRKGSAELATTPPGQGGAESLSPLAALPAQPSRPPDAEELVRLFYKTFHGVDKSYPPSKAVDQAVALIANHGLEQAKYVLEFSRQEAQQTNYQPQTFGGILQYTSRALADYERRKKDLEQAQRRQAAHHEYRRLEEAYEAYRESATARYVADHPEAYHELLQAKTQEFLKQSERNRLYPKATLEQMMEAQVRSEIERRLPLLTFDEWHRARQPAAAPASVPPGSPEQGSAPSAADMPAAPTDSAGTGLVN
jgi:hypothetical protein